MHWPGSEEIRAEDVAEIARILSSLPDLAETSQIEMICLAVLAKYRNNEFLNLLFKGHPDKPAMQEKIDTALTLALGEGHTFTGHGIARNLASRYNDDTLGRVFGAIARFCEDLERDLGIQAFVTSGTLLGLIRDGRVIPHDDDFDLAYISAHSDRDAIRDERRRVYDYIRGLDYLRIGVNGGHFGVSSADKGTPFYFDLFTAWLEDGCFNEDPLDPGVIPAEEILPLKRRAFYGVELPIPRHPRALLKVNYGPGWRSPDPSFRFDFKKNAHFYGFLRQDDRSPHYGQ